MATRPWAHLPPELLSLIADRLGIIGLLSFRSVCKGWNSASSTSTAQIESSPKLKPWFLLYGENSDCFLVSETGDKYKINIPEMNGATCIASKDGWLLLYREGSMFFFCPFSGSKIELPQFPKSEQRDLVAAFSSPPTSQDCIVSVACQNSLKFELHLLYRGSNAWTLHEFNEEYMKTIKGAGYVNKTFHFYDDSNKFITFSPSSSLEEKFKPNRIVTCSKEEYPNYDVLPFYLSRNSFERYSMNKRLGLAENVSLCTCGTVVAWDLLDKIFFNESISQQSEGGESQSQGRQQLKGVWINPRFYQIPPETTW